MVNAINSGASAPQMAIADAPVVSTGTPSLNSGVSGAPAPAPVAQAEKIPSGFVAVIPKSGVNVNLDQVHQNVQDAIGKLNDMLQQNGTGLSFAMDKSVGIPIITVTSSVSGEVIRQIPNEAVLNVAHNIDAIKGLLYNSIA
jgi:flagellar protein FlaG